MLAPFLLRHFSGQVNRSVGQTWPEGHQFQPLMASCSQGWSSQHPRAPPPCGQQRTERRLVLPPSPGTLKPLHLGAVTFGAFNSRSGRQRGVMNSQIIPSPRALQASRPSCLPLPTHLSLGGGDWSKAGSDGGGQESPLRASDHWALSRRRIQKEKSRDREKRKMGLAVPTWCVLS